MLKVTLNSFGKKKYFFKNKHNFLFFNNKNLLTHSRTESDINSTYRKENEIILHKSYLLKDSKINDIINILNLYIRLKNENIELLKNVSINLLMNKEKLRYNDIVIILKKFSVIKCKNYYLFCYFKDALIDNLHLLSCNELIDVYFSFTNLNYFHYNFYLLIEKKLFHNFNLIDLKKLIFLIQCFNKKKIISKNYLTILLYSISKNINKFNTFQLSVIFSFFKNFNINNSILINSLIHNFNQNVNLNDSPKYLSLFYNFLSYVNKKCKNNYQYFKKEKELIGVIKQFKLKFEEEKIKYEDKLHKIEENQEITNEYNKEEMKIDKEKMNYEEESKKKKKEIIDKYLKKNISLLENNILFKGDELQQLKEQTHLLKKDSYNFNLMYSIKNALKNIEIITKKKIKHMSVQSLCLISSALSNIDKNKLILEKIAEEVGKQSTKLTPLLVSFLLLSFSKSNHKHGSLIYYSLQFFYKYHKFFNINEVGILCKGLQNFSIKENEFICILNEVILNNLGAYNNIYKEKKKCTTDSLNYNSNKYLSDYNIEKLFYDIEKNIEKNIECMSYEDQFKNLKKVHKDEDKEYNDNNKNNSYDKKYSEFVNFSYIDYENIKKNNYYPNNLYNIKIDNSIYINNIIYILEYYSFNLIRINKILDIFCDIFIKSDLNYILYSRIFYSFYLLQYQDKKIYELIENFNNNQSLYQVMYKEKHMMKIIESLIYFYENKKENKMVDIYFYVLPKSSFSFIFNFSKYFLTFLFIKNNNHVFHKFLLTIKDISLGKEYIFLHKPNNLY
ncbi:conserved Plasmodium protein, unknown function [Plasmodium relictum]|uniref:Uncharacterized protein n=1 Tax=Plasmodium relictum TaxID=85471 RepID=A0A1J1GNL3_PLARL|nr:conserved Plasmodium protein, unknown function [Plasmodium relictum]CRG85379.1 conserved Plasmodium protein, unknown function [Plasmodium relictum]